MDYSISRLIAYSLLKFILMFCNDINFWGFLLAFLHKFCLIFQLFSKIFFKTVEFLKKSVSLHRVSEETRI